MSEIYGSGSRDRGDGDASGPDRGYSSFGSGWGGPWRPDYSVYYRDAPGEHDYDPGAGGHEDGPGEGGQDQYDDPESYADPAEQEQGMTRWEYAEYVRNPSADTDADDSDNGWDSDPDAENYADLRYLDDAATQASLDEADLPICAAPRAAILGSDSAGFDGTSPDVGNDGHGSAESTDGAAMDNARAWTLPPQATDTTARGDYLSAEAGNPDELAGQADTDAHAAGRSIEAADAWSQRVGGLEAANAEMKAANAEMKAENAELGKNMAELAARLERVEQYRQDKPAGEVASRRLQSEERTGGLDDNEARWHAPSDEALVFGAAAVGGVLTTVADFIPYLPATEAGIAASFLVAGAAGVAWMHKRREARHADRSKD